SRTCMHFGRRKVCQPFVFHQAISWIPAHLPTTRWQSGSWLHNSAQYHSIQALATTSIILKIETIYCTLQKSSVQSGGNLYVMPGRRDKQMKLSALCSNSPIRICQVCVASIHTYSFPRTH